MNFNKFYSTTFWTVTVKSINKHKFLYLMFIPVALYYILFHYVPMGGIIIAFKDYNVLKGFINSPWVGLKNFKLAFTDEYFWQVTRNTVLISLYKLIFYFPIPIILAILLNEMYNIKFKRIVQTIIYLPHFISWVIMGSIIVSFLSVNTGVINRIIQLFGGEPIFFLARKDLFRSLLVISSILKEAGWGSIIYIAAITGINPELYEAAYVDGAKRMQQIFYITIPSILGTIVVMFILSLSNILNAGFEQVFVLYNPLVMEVGDIIDTYVYRSGLLAARYSYSTAVGLVKSVISLILILSSDRVFKAFGTQGFI